MQVSADGMQQVQQQAQQTIGSQPQQNVNQTQAMVQGTMLLCTYT